MRSLIAIGVLTLGIGTASAQRTVTFEISPQVMGEINVSTDSSRGWLPTADQRQKALRAAERFLRSIEAGRYDDAYAMLTSINMRNQSRPEFIAEAEKFRTIAGAVKFWRVSKITWTKDPARAPLPGIYAAIDLVAAFANVDRDCGFMVLYQPSADTDFAIMRRENNYLDNETARKMEAQKSKADVTRVWRQISRYCPNYIPSD
jgi:hypothetical protein